jgi:small subunit ribosomal protein S20
MPVIKSTKKRIRQSAKHRARNFPIRNELKTLIKKELDFTKDGKLEEATKFLPVVYSAIDTACKKNLIVKNNAARKKSRLALALNKLQANGGKKVEPVVEKAKKAAKVEKKTEKVEGKK